MNRLPYVSDGCRVSVLFLERVYKVTGLYVVVTASAGCHVCAVPEFIDSEYLQSVILLVKTGSH